MFTISGAGGAESSRWPLDHLNTRDPERITPFLLGLGYSGESVLNTLVTRCNIDKSTAEALIARHDQKEG